MSVHPVCASMLDEMHVNTAVQILPFCLMHNLLQGVSSASPLLPPLQDKHHNERFSVWPCQVRLYSCMSICGHTSKLSVPPVSV